MANCFHIITVLWGRRFVERFLATTLPSILSPGNLPALKAAAPTTYSLYTTDDDADRIWASDLFRSLASLIEIEFVTDEPVSPQVKYERATALYRQGLQESARRDAGTVILTPDAIWSDGSLARIAALSREGYRAVVADGLRAIEDSFLPALAAICPPDPDGIISAQPRDLMQTALDHLHPFEAVATWGSEYIHDVPYRLHHIVPGQGIISRGFCGHPIFVYPETEELDFVGAIDHGMLQVAINDPEKIYYARDTDEIGIVSVDGIGFSSQNLRQCGRRSRMLDMAKWAYHHATPQNLNALRHGQRRIAASGAERPWQLAERISDRHASTILAGRNLIEVIVVMDQRGASDAAAIVSFGLHELGLLTDFARPGPITLLAPLEIDGRLRDVLTNFQQSPAFRNKLRGLMRAHALRGHVPLGELPRVYPGVETVGEKGNFGCILSASP
jgi:hypothetical protein